MRNAFTWLMSCLAVTLIGAAGVACSSGQGKGASEVSLAQLAAGQESYNGKQVSTSGTVREFSDSGSMYYVLEGAEQDRVALEPAEDAAPYSGKDVTVTGRFTFDQDTGRRIEIESISETAPVPSPSGTSPASDVAQPGGEFVRG